MFTEFILSDAKIVLAHFDNEVGLQAFVYVSTLYCQSHLSHIDEKFYPGALTEEEMETLLYSFDYETLALLTPK